MPRLRVALLTGAAAIVLALAAILGGTSGNSTRGPNPSQPSTPAGASSPSGFDGAALPTDVPAPGFALRDERGRRVALADYRGQVVILTFLAPTATGTSALIAQQIRGALDDLARPVPALAVSAGTVAGAGAGADSPARVRGFLASAALSGRMEYLSGSRAQLRAIWHAYRVTPLSAGQAAFDRAATVRLIDARGRERVLFGVEQLTPEALAHDVRLLRAGR